MVSVNFFLGGRAQVYPKPFREVGSRVDFPLSLEVGRRGKMVVLVPVLPVVEAVLVNANGRF